MMSVTITVRKRCRYW